MRAGALAAGTALEPGTVSPPKSREVTGWLMCRPDALDAHDQQRLACLRTQCPHLDHLADHVTSFAKMIIERTGAQELEAWLARVEADDQPELHSFAAGIRRDQDAITAGLILPYSSGSTEGNVNRLMIKRQMYGRASLLPVANASSSTSGGGADR